MSTEKRDKRGDAVCGIRMIHPERIARARADAFPARVVGRLARTFRALGDPTRLGIVMALRKGEMCVCDLAALLELSESAVSHQLRHLRDLALVRNRREGQVLYYSLDDAHVAELIEIGLEHAGEIRT